jgi:hypothetical protein
MTNSPAPSAQPTGGQSVPASDMPSPVPSAGGTFDRPSNATPRAELERRVMDVNIAKSETEWWAEREISELRSGRQQLEEDNARLRKTLSAAQGYLLNAKIDLETGAPKTTAINTIIGGLQLVGSALRERSVS